MIYAIVVERRVISWFDNEHDARAEWERICREGYPEIRSVAVWRGDSLEQIDDRLAERVRLVCAGMTRGAFEEWQAAREKERDAEDAA